jgi:hypothetical protein
MLLADFLCWRCCRALNTTAITQETLQDANPYAVFNYITNLYSLFLKVAAAIDS